MINKIKKSQLSYVIVGIFTLVPKPRVCSRPTESVQIHEPRVKISTEYKSFSQKPRENFLFIIFLFCLVFKVMCRPSVNPKKVQKHFSHHDFLFIIVF
jgi:hypothetical protein